LDEKYDHGDQISLNHGWSQQRLQAKITQLLH